VHYAPISSLRSWRSSRVFKIGAINLLCNQYNVSPAILGVIEKSQILSYIINSNLAMGNCECGEDTENGKPLADDDAV